MAPILLRLGTMTPLVLSSTSPYRKELLARLGLPFVTAKPLFNEESAKASFQSPEELCLYLGQEKAKSLGTADNCVIGGDQMLVLKDSQEWEIFGKPGNFQKAFEQLSRLQGRSHELLTSVSVSYKRQLHQFMDRTKMYMLPLTENQIRKYLATDEPFDCAGAYKIEKSGIILFQRIDTKDFTAIQGLPLLKLAETLRHVGYEIP